MKNVDFKELAEKARVKTQKFVDSHRGTIGLCVGTVTGLYVGYRSGIVATLVDIKANVPEAWEIIKTAAEAAHK